MLRGILPAMIRRPPQLSLIADGTMTSDMLADNFNSVRAGRRAGASRARTRAGGDG